MAGRRELLAPWASRPARGRDPFWALDAEIYTPLVFPPDKAHNRDMSTLRVFGRLKPGVAWAQAAEDMRAILLELKKAIDTELNDPAYQQLSLFDDLEKDQFERNKDFLRDRSKAIPAEIERETTAIKSRYADPQPRMFPVAVTFLVPEKMRRG